MIQQKINNGTILLGKKKGGVPDEKWTLSIGSAVNRKNQEVKLNSATPHVVFVCGARGSGKSYTLGVIAEEIAKNNSNLAAVIVDPVGVFWSMKYANREKEEIELLENLGKKPQGIKNMKVFVPAGYKSDIPKETFDTEFSFKPSRLKTDDWCLTFGIDRYSPQGLLLERGISKVKGGYTRKLGDKLESGSRDVSPNENFTIDDLLECINHDRELLSKKKGFKGSTRRALTSRLSAAKDWGIFGEEKKLSDLITPGKISVIDISFLPENIGSLVLGMLARKILAARKSAARKEAVSDLKGSEREESSGSIPPIWLLVDEAHSFAPSSGKTAATDPLVEYVKQGRRPGLSAVLSTQQPSALNSKIISQLDVLLSHRLSFENDIRKVWKRMPTTLPKDLKEPDSLKKLSEGTAIVADKEASQAFLISIRPRFSQHEGRERVTKTAPLKETAAPETEWETESYEEQQSEKYTPKQEEVLIVPSQIVTEEAVSIAESKRKRFLGFLWTTEKVRRISKYYYPVWSTLVDYYPKDGSSINIRAQMDGLTGELIQRKNKQLVRTKGVRILPDLSSSEREVLYEILEVGPVEIRALENKLSKSRTSGIIESLKDKGIIKTTETEGKRFLDLKSEIDMPIDLAKRSLLAAEEIPERKPEFVSPDKKIDRVISEEKMLKILETFGDLEIIERELFYYPYWTAELTNETENRILAIDGVTGNRDQYVERMLRRRIK